MLNKALLVLTLTIKTPATYVSNVQAVMAVPAATP